jgi:6-phosphogluconolactonase (cycloisomerase 2 family)
VIEATGVSVKAEGPEIHIYVNGRFFCASNREKIEQDMAVADSVRDRLAEVHDQLMNAWTEHGVAPEALRRPE